MEDDTRKLLIGIGQPEFAYRTFNHADARAVVEKWPLVERLAASPQLQASLGRPNAPRSVGRAAPAHPAGKGPAQAGFLKAYDPVDHPRPPAQSAVDVRALLGRLAREMS